MSLSALCVMLLSQVSVQSLSGTAQLTWYTSYAPCCEENENYDPNYSTIECVQYNACAYAGHFWAIGYKNFSYVQNNNLVAFFDSSDENGTNFMTNYGRKTILLNKSGTTFTATIADSCHDRDCDGCCMRNSQPSGFLVDMEYWTAITNFGSTQTIYGEIQFAIDNIIITNHNHTQQYWIAFYISNVDLSCGGSIVNVEITDNKYYSGTWVAYDDNQHGYYHFPNDGIAFIAPISVRITKSNNGINESIVAHNLTGLTGGQMFDFGSNFCVSITETNHTTSNTTTVSSSTSDHSRKIPSTTTVESSTHHHRPKIPSSTSSTQITTSEKDCKLQSLSIFSIIVVACSIMKII